MSNTAIGLGTGMGITRLDWRDRPPSTCRGGVVSVGNFDGVHRGHAALLAEARRTATTMRACVAALTFDPHPLKLLAPERFQPLLTTPARRAELLHEVGADEVIVLRTTPELLALEARDFFDQLLRERLGAKAVVEGFNFRFGHDRKGENAALKRWCEEAGMRFCEAAPFCLNGQPVSSSRVRQAIESGRIDEAIGLLNRPHRADGTVGHGAHRGRTIGFPTANLEGVETLLPKEGVYAVRALVEGKPFAAAANIGPNPTFGEQSRKIEIHLIDFTGDLYGKVLAVDFLARLRETQKFTTVDELIAQMKRDVSRAREVCSQP